MADAEFSTRDRFLAYYLHWKDPHRDDASLRAFLRYEWKADGNPVWFFRDPDRQARLKRQYDIDVRPYATAAKDLRRLTGEQDTTP